MVLEATMIILDNSDWMRNGDYPPTRLGAQTDCTTLVFNSKTQSNAENTVGVMTSGGVNGPQVLVTLTSNLGKVLQALHRLPLGGEVNFSTSVQIAQLALKHRQNKNQRQRILIFIASPIAEDEKGLIKLAKKLKKNNVAVDIVSFGDWEQNQEKLTAFIENVNNGDNSHLVTIPPGPRVLSDVVLVSAVIQGEGSSAAVSIMQPSAIPPAAATTSGPSFEGDDMYDFGVDASIDPELALALRLSLQEEEARQAAARARVAEPPNEPTVAEAMEAADVEVTVADPAISTAPSAAAANILDEDVDMLSEEEQIARAIALSMGQSLEQADEPQTSTGAVTTTNTSEKEEEVTKEENK